MWNYNDIKLANFHSLYILQKTRGVQKVQYVSVHKIMYGNSSKADFFCYAPKLMP